MRSVPSSSAVLALLAFFLAAPLMLPVKVSAQTQESDQPSDVAAALELVRRAYAEALPIRARFSQTVTSGMGGAQRSAGVVWLAPPGKMRWAFEEPDERAFVSDGAQLWIWLPADRQVQHMRQLQGGQLVRLYEFVYGLTNIEGSFQIARQADRDGAMVLALTPRTTDWGVRDVQVLVDSGTGFVVEVAYTDDFGTRTVTSFSDHTREATLSPEVFQFRAPDGAEVIEL